MVYYAYAADVPLSPTLAADPKVQKILSMPNTVADEGTAENPVLSMPDIATIPGTQGLGPFDSIFKGICGPIRKAGIPFVCNSSGTMIASLIGVVVLVVVIFLVMKKRR